MLTKQTGVPVRAILLPDQPTGLTLAASYEGNRYWLFQRPGYFDFEPANVPAPGDSYTGRVALPISNTANPPVMAPYRVQFVNPYPLQASVSSLSFTWRIGDPLPAAQSFTLTKQGKPLLITFVGSPFPSWLTVQNGDNGPPETITVGVQPAA